MTEKTYTASSLEELYKLIIADNEKLAKSNENREFGPSKIQAQLKENAYQKFKQDHLDLPLQQQFEFAIKLNLEFFQRLEQDNKDKCNYVPCAVIACKRNNLEAFKYVIKDFNLDCLFISVMNNYHEILAYMVDKFYENWVLQSAPNDKHLKIYTLYYYLPIASYLGFIKIVEYILTYSENQKSKYQGGIGSIHQALIDKAIVYTIHTDNDNVYKFFQEFKYKENCTYSAHSINYEQFMSDMLEYKSFKILKLLKLYGRPINVDCNNKPIHKNICTNNVSDILYICNTIDEAKEFITLIKDNPTYHIYIAEWIIECKRKKNKELEEYLLSLI